MSSAMSSAVGGASLRNFDLEHHEETHAKKHDDKNLPGGNHIPWEKLKSKQQELLEQAQQRGMDYLTPNELAAMKGGFNGEEEINAGVLLYMASHSQSFKVFGIVIVIYIAAFCLGMWYNSNASFVPSNTNDWGAFLLGMSVGIVSSMFLHARTVRKCMMPENTAYDRLLGLGKEGMFCKNFRECTDFGPESVESVSTPEMPLSSEMYGLCRYPARFTKTLYLIAVICFGTGLGLVITSSSPTPNAFLSAGVGMNIGYLLGWLFGT